MAMGRKPRERQESLWVETSALATAPGHPFYERLNGILAFHTFDEFVEERCAKFYAEMGYVLRSSQCCMLWFLGFFPRTCFIISRYGTGSVATACCIRR